jgi:hypothetical protein
MVAALIAAVGLVTQEGLAARRSGVRAPALESAKIGAIRLAGVRFSALAKRLA